MDSIVSSIITPVVGSLMVPIKKHFGFLFFSTKYVKDMKEKIDQLNLTEKDIRQNWEEAVARNQEVSHHVSPWLEKVKKMNEKAQSISMDGISCFNFAKRYKAGKKAYDFLEEIEAHVKSKSEIEFTKEQRPLADVASSSTLPSTSTFDGTQNNFKSREQIYKAALKSLEPNNESQKMIALCGMGGVGKTTMMEQLKKDVEISKMFDKVVKVVIGENNDLIAIQRAIAKYISLEDLREETNDARSDRLRRIFEGISQQGKKVLVIMDDLWKEFDLKDVGLNPLPNGFKLLFTSRYEHVCTRMGVRINSIFKVGFLNDEEAKTLFFGIVGLSDGDDPTLQQIGEAIVKKCGGLPIAIVTMAKSLCDNIKEAWKKALRRLEKDDLEDLESITHRIFEISYENIKKDDEKAVFLLSGLFPDDFDIRIEDLLRYGWGLGFFKDVRTLAIARSDLKICVNNLIRANLLTKSDKMGCVKMHDLVRAFVLDKVSEVKQASIMNHDNQLKQDAKVCNERVLLKCTGMTEFPTDFNYPNLSMLMLIGGNQLLKFPDDIRVKMEKLEVMSYENLHIPVYPIMIEHSTKLRTLCLRFCHFINDDISLIGSLGNLETLSLIDCRISRLPTSIGKLKKLKLLDVTGYFGWGCVQLRIDDGVFENLISLEELYMRGYGDSAIMFTKANCDELEILSHGLFALELEFLKNKPKPKNMSWENLERFRISIGRKLAKLEDDKKNLFRNTLQVVGDYNELLECKIGALFNKTEELHLEMNGMNHLEDALTHHSLSNLVALYISKCANLTFLFTAEVASGLQKLERLTISECPVFRTIIVKHSKVGVIRFKKLKFMSLTNLPEMESFSDNVIELPEVVELKLGELSKFTSIYPHNKNTSEMLSLFNKVVIPHLEILLIYWMENLKYIWSCETFDKDNVSMLRKITVTKCDSLINLFPSNPLPLIYNLENLEVKDCRSIEVLFNMEFKNICATREYNRCKLRSIIVERLGKLKELWRMQGVNKCDIQVKCFKGVESIEIRDCGIFTNIFTPITTKFDLQALNDYKIYNTGEKPNVFLEGERSEMDEYIPNVTYPSNLLLVCPHLQRIVLCDDRRVEEVVFDMDSHQPLLLPYLELLALIDLNEMSNVWKCNWNKFLIPQHQPLNFPFQNLKDISLKSCHKIKYLFSPLMAKFLFNLNSVSIRECDGIEEVISSRDDINEENTSTFTSSLQKNTLFPHLDTLRLIGLACLKSVDEYKSFSITSTTQDESQSGGQVISRCWSLCQYPTKIEIHECPTLMKLFESEFSTNNFNEGSKHSGANSILTAGPTLQNNTTLVVPQLSNLKHLSIYDCNLLSHVFTFSTLESLKQLKELIVSECDEIQVIVEKENEMSSKDVVIPLLNTLELNNLPNLQGFFLGMNELRWPLLENVMISGCPQMVMFTSGESKTPKLKHISTWLGKHSAEYCGLNFHGMINAYQTTITTSSSPNLAISEGMCLSFHNLIEINLYNAKVERPIIPFHALSQLQKLQQITLKDCSLIKELSEIVALEESSGFNKSQTIVQIPNLTLLKLDWVYDLKYIWNSNRWMVLEFPNLTTLSIHGCNRLEHVFTFSIFNSLMQLQDLVISNCFNMKAIIKEEEEESDTKVNHDIVLPRLRSLHLIGLLELKGFCLGNEAFSWPSLDTLQIYNCPKITVFTKGPSSTPKLKVIDTTFGRYYVKPDLNSFMKTKLEEGYMF